MRSPKDGANHSTAIAGASGHAAAHPPLTGSAPRPLVADLLSLRELQASLALEESDDAVVRVGTNAIVEILAIDCGLAIVETAQGRPPLRFGWLQGRAMTAPEMDSLQRTLEREIAEVRDGSSGTRLLADAPGTPGGAPALPPAVRALGFGAVLLLGLGSGGKRSGSLVLAARDAEAFQGEPAILAEILAAQMSEQCGRVRAASRVVRVNEAPTARAASATPAGGNVAAGVLPGAAADLKALQARVRALEAQAAIVAAVSLSHDTDRQVLTALRKAIELTGHVAGAIYLVETNDACDDILRLAQGVGDAQWLETAALPRWRPGEGLPGRIWASGEGASFPSLADDPAGIGKDVVTRAGYRRMLCEPLKARGRTVGVIEMFGDREGAYDADERSLGRAIADQVGMAIHNARLVADLMRHGMDLEWQIERASSENRRALESRLGIEGSMIAASAEHDPEARALAVLDRILEMTGADAACLHAVEAEGGAFRLVSQRRFPAEVIEAFYHRPASDPVLQRAPASGGVAIVDLATEEAVAAGWTRRAGVRTVALVPCRSGGAVRGVLTLGSRYVAGFGERERDAMAAVAALLGLVLECAEAESRTGASERSAAALADEVARVIAVDDAAEPGPESKATPATASSPLATAPGDGDAAGAGAQPEPERLAQAQKMSSIGKLAAGIERELNGTIGAIMGHASHIRALVPDHNPVHDKAAVIEEQSHRAADLVKRVLTFSRGGIGTRERLDLNLLVDETRALLSRTLDPSIVLETRAGKDLPAVQVDPGELRQVLLNLAVNARDALPDGGRIVFETRSGHLDAAAVSTLPGLPPGDYVAVVISDNGAGMTHDVLDHAFEPFFTTKPLAQGSGLGLTVAQDIVRDHGGQIALSSAPGIGTAARLYLPVAPAVPVEKGAPGGAKRDAAAGGAGKSTQPVDASLVKPGGAGAPGAATSAAGADTAKGASGPDILPWLRTCPLTEKAKGRIMVVDDEPVLRDMMAEMLRSRGYEVTTARDGVDALEIYRREWGKIDLVIVDLIMPRLGGLETFRRVVGMNRKARVLLCSGNAQHALAQQALQEGAVGVLPKPFGMSELAGWVEKGLAA